MHKFFSSFFDKIGSIIGHKDTSVNQKISPVVVDINISNVVIIIKTDED